MARYRRHNPANLTLYLTVTLFILSSLLACAVDINRIPLHTKGYMPPRLEVLATENSKAVAWYRRNEWQYNKGDKNLPPET